MGKQERREAKQERDSTKQLAVQDKTQKEAEDIYWKAHGEGDKSKAQKKREEEDAKKVEAAAKKAELKRLAEAEAATLVKPKAGPQKVASKITKYQLDLQRETDEKLRLQEIQDKSLAVKREVAADEYSRLLGSHENTNRLADALHASGVEAALDVLTLAGPEPEPEKHPEKRAKAAWKAFEEKLLPDLRHEKPGLKLNQYKELLWKQWLKSPDNPLNQPVTK